MQWQPHDFLQPSFPEDLGRATCLVPVPLKFSKGKVEHPLTCSGASAPLFMTNFGWPGRPARPLLDCPSLPKSQSHSLTWHLPRSTSKPLSFPFNRFPNQVLLHQDFSVSNNNKAASASGDRMALLPWHISTFVSLCSDKTVSRSRFEQPFNVHSCWGGSGAVSWFKPLPVLIWQECCEDQRVKNYNCFIS